MDEAAVRKRRADGTPCTQGNFEVWKARFETEMAERALEEEERVILAVGKKKEKVVDKSGRSTGFEQFSGKVGMLNMDDIERAAEEALEDEDEIRIEGMDQNLFEDDDDLDDMDFDSDDDEDFDTDEDEPDI